MSFRLLGLIALAMAATLPVHAAAPSLTPYTAEYEVIRNDKPLGRGMVTLKQVAGGQWELLSVTEGTKGMASLAGVEIRERSLVSLQDDTLETRAYDYQQSAGWKKRQRSVSFDTGRIVSRDKDQDFTFDLSPGVLERQAVSLALSRDVAAGKRDVLSYTVVDRDELGPQRYRVGAEEQVTTPAGTLPAIRVERDRDGDTRGRQTTSWLGVNQGYVPVRVLQTEADGGSFEMRLVSITR